LAQAASCFERYIEDWLLLMAANGIFEYNKENNTFNFRPEAAELYATELGPHDLMGGFYAVVQSVANLPRIKENFTTGGGIPWGDMGADLHYGTERFLGSIHLHHLVQHWFPLVLEGLLVKNLEAGVTLADIGCGRGISTITMAKRFPKSQFHGYDYHKDSVDKASQKAHDSGISNAKFFVADSTLFGEEKVYDIICIIDSFHDMGNPLGCAKRCKQVLKDNGMVLLIEPWGGNDMGENVASPVGALLGGFSVLCCSQCSRAAGGPAIGTMCPTPAIQDIWKQAGFLNFSMVPIKSPLNRFFLIQSKL